MLQCYWLQAEWGKPQCWPLKQEQGGSQPWLQAGMREQWMAGREAQGQAWRAGWGGLGRGVDGLKPQPAALLPEQAMLLL